MKINNNLLISRNSCIPAKISFKKFEGKEIYGLMDRNGNFSQKIMENLENSQFYQDLCKQYDVIVKIGTVKDISDKGKYVTCCEIYYRPVSAVESWFKKPIYALTKPYPSYKKIQTGRIKSNSQYNAESELTCKTGLLLYQIKEILHK